MNVEPIAAISTVLVADYVETFPAEVKYVWLSPWTFVKVLFLLARCSVFLEAVFVIGYSFTETADLTPLTCDVWLALTGMSVVSSIALAEAIFFIRIYALSGRSRLMWSYLILQWTTVHVAQFVLMGYIVRSFAFPIIPGVVERIGCFGIPLPRSIPMLTALFSLPVFSGMMLVLIMGYLGLRKFRLAHATNLITIYFRDGYLYFLVIASLAIVNVILGLKITGPSNLVIGESQGVLYSILSCRLLLHMRHVGGQTTHNSGDGGHNDGGVSDQLSLEPIHFANAGACRTYISGTSSGAKTASEYS
ncbi:hypothetical protein FA15DRAFT_314032 [Coprinopsis marcescibilis]|uniref:DUF6533 domain-containing protein n=1 Tax=Coprinopsis marcescibilis TaxID=230819 RepID=A0A5C3KC69_COPMA|nr:hypothetical protein FA15DRAFT_314032 [Coprinopsis marcescibilis]